MRVYYLVTINLKVHEWKLERNIKQHEFSSIFDCSIHLHSYAGHANFFFFGYHVQNIQVTQLLFFCNYSDGETFISADDLRINLWNLEISSQSFNIVDVKPTNMEDLTGTTFSFLNCKLSLDTDLIYI